MNPTELKLILKHKNNPCVSLILPTNLHAFSEKEKLELSLKKAVLEAENLLQGKFEKRLIRKLIEMIEFQIDKIDTTHLQKALGIFVSESYANLVYFPFEVPRRVIVDSSFEVRDVIDNMNLFQPYLVLLLDKKKCRLFHGIGNEFVELKKDNFPMEYTNDYQYEKAHPRIYNTPEESKINEARLKAFLKEVDHTLTSFSDHTPIFITGVEEILSLFLHESVNKSKIAGKVEGSYGKLPVSELKDRIWPMKEAYLKNRQQSMVEKAKEAVLTGRGVSGIQEVWDVAGQGVGSELLVERNYTCQAYLSGNDNSLLLQKTADADTAIPDAVELVIDKLNEYNHTNIHVVENDFLKDFGRIILTTKY